MPVFRTFLKAITFVMAFNFLYGQEFKSHTVKITPAEDPLIDFENDLFVESVFKEYESIEKDKSLLKKYVAYCLEDR